MLRVGGGRGGRCPKGDEDAEGDTVRLWRDVRVACGLLKIKQRSKKEPPHNRDGTPCGKLAIPYIDLIWSCGLLPMVLLLLLTVP